ncbi:hypothetical protein [Erythrobacter sp. 3-20A1M]|uniref:hypothetical protein n=1 Tax=Erythrobacter sp. 3-20A1M TaxID=2653850 RepID=UPI001BFCA510|nr:hypothetical protein [Erythrobacter sp. 3-20A1M]
MKHSIQEPAQFLPVRKAPIIGRHGSCRTNLKADEILSANDYSLDVFGGGECRHAFRCPDDEGDLASKLAGDCHRPTLVQLARAFLA